MKNQSDRLVPSDYKNTKILVETNPGNTDNPLVTIYPYPESDGTQMNYESWLSESNNKEIYPQSLTKEIEQAVAEYYRKRQEKGKEEKKKPRSVAAKIFKNGDMVESCYDPMTGESFFMHWIEAQQRAEKILQIIDPSSTEKLIPLRDKNVTSGLMLLPSGTEEYGSIADLVKDISALIESWVDFPPGMSGYFCMAVLQTYVYEKCPALPINDFRADSGAGKTRALEVAAHISYRGYRAGGASTYAALVRLIDIWKPTLCLNENDLGLSDMTSPYAKMLNERTDPRGAVLLNIPGSDGGWVPTPFLVFGPTLMTTRQPFSDNALESRCVHFRMTETERDDILLNLPYPKESSPDAPQFITQAASLRNKLLLFRFRNLSLMQNDYRLVVPKVRKRTLQVMQPMLSLVKSLEPDLFPEIVSMLQEMDREGNEANYDCEVGHIIRALYNLECGDEGRDPDRTPSSKKIAGKIEEMFGDKISSVTVGRHLSGLGLKQKRGRERGWSLGDGKKRDKILTKYCPEYNLGDYSTGCSSLDNPNYFGGPDTGNLTETTEKSGNSKR